ncbi:MAG: glycoside hydrolase family 9 protein [Bacteroidota bacterium]
MEKLLLLIGFPLLLTEMLHASDFISIHAVSDRVLELHFDDGYLILHQIGQSIQNDRIVADELDVQAASILGNYLISSSTDAAYQSPLSPINIYRKSKGTEFANLCEGWQVLSEFGVQGCDNSSQDHAKEHWIYLVLPTAMQEGQEYQIQLFGFDFQGNRNQTFTFSKSSSQSSAIHLNNLGYSPSSNAKFAYVYKWLGDGGSMDLSAYNGNAFDLIDLDNNQLVFSGSLSFRKDAFSLETFQQNPAETPNQNFLGAEVYECDFSSFDLPGNYKLSIAGIGSSNAFQISCDVLEPAFNYSMKGIFQNRSGIDLKPPYIKTARPAPHNPQQTPGFGNRLKFTSTSWCDLNDSDADTTDKALWEAGYLGDLQSSGWYQDAGDWDAYPSHMRVPSQLLFSFEHFPQNFWDGQLNIPENQNGIPDILDEARWLLRFYKRLKDETEQKGWTTGGVPGGRILGDLWGNDTGPGDIAQYSYQDTGRDWYVSGEDPFMSYWYAASIAHLAWLYDRENLGDPENIDWQTEAIAAFNWAEARYSTAYVCHDFQLPGIRSYAAAALYRLSQNNAYAQDFEDAIADLDLNSQPGLSDIDAYGAYVYALTPNLSRNSNLLADLEANIEQTADELLINYIDNRACRWGGNIFFPMLVGHATTPFVFEGIMGYVWARENGLNKADDYLSSLYTTADYFLGSNPLKISWITGLNEFSPTAAFHLDARQNGNMEGYIPYGPWRRENLVNIGPWHHQWAEKTHYPIDPDVWPGHERWYAQTTSPKATEFIIHQNNLNAASLYGALAGERACTERANSVESLEELPLFSLHPNPAKEIIELNLDRGKLGLISCYDLKGNLIFRTSSPYSSQRLEIDFLPAGMYVILVQGRAVKFLKE